MTMDAIRYLASSVTLLGLSGCVADVALRGEHEITCAADADCPAPSSCRATLGVCVPPGTETEPPSILHSWINPVAGSFGMTMVVVIESTEALHEPPVLWLRD